MALSVQCPRCSAPVFDGDGAWSCRDHGPIAPLWRVQEPTYDDLATQVGRVDPLPTLLPWPMRPGWGVSDFGYVARDGEPAVASFVTCTGSNDLDGVVEVTLVAEEPGVGLGARVADVDHTDPGGEIDGPPHARVSVDGREVPLWALTTSGRDTVFDRSVFVGEAQGRWLWVVLRPPSAALLLADGWTLQDLAALGPELLELTFLDVPKPW